MSASSPLRACLIGLVLVDLVFVHLTEAAGLQWLAPLYALTLASPLLVPWREKLAYRGLWNAAVLGVFAVLLRHATGNDMRFVLEDGLVLSALCQVHLLNNLRARQRPDLLFLNSFLIAIVTGHLSQDLAFAAAFLVYVPLLLVGLQLQSLTERGAHPSPATVRHLAADGARRAGVLLALSLLTFLLLPRDFHREGLLELELDFKTPGSDAEIGFSDGLRLDRQGRVQASDRLVMSVELLAGSRRDVPALWRGATLGATNGKEWWSLDGGDLADPASEQDAWIRRGRELVRAPQAAPEGPRVSVEILDPTSDRLFAPLSSRRLVLGRGLEVDGVSAQLDGTLRHSEPASQRPRPGYEISLASGAEQALGGKLPERLGPELARYAALPRSRRLQSAGDLAARLAARLGDEAEQHALVTSFADHLASTHPYLPPGAEGSPESLEQFLAGDTGGHCEFFASALATMLRSRGIPCRLVTGYRSSEWDAAGKVLTFRSLHAHAWVEVLDPAAGWYEVDPSPFLSLDRRPGAWARLHAGLGAAWARLASFDSKRREAVFAWLGALPGQGWERICARPWTSALALGALSILIELARRRRRRGSIASLRHYQRALRRGGLRLQQGETPRELLARARARALPPARFEALETATREHERSRYAA